MEIENYIMSNPEPLVDRETIILSNVDDPLIVVEAGLSPHRCAMIFDELKKYRPVSGNLDTPVHRLIERE